MRLRPRFSLRMLFVLVTVISVPLGWLSYQSHWVWQRREFIQTLDSSTISPRPYYRMRDGSPEVYPQPKQSMSWIRRILGDQEYSLIVLPVGYTQQMIDNADGLFPEAHTEKWMSSTIDGHNWNYSIDVTKY